VIFQSIPITSLGSLQSTLLISPRCLCIPIMLILNSLNQQFTSSPTLEYHTTIVFHHLHHYRHHLSHVFINLPHPWYYLQFTAHSQSPQFSLWISAEHSLASSAHRYPLWTVWIASPATHRTASAMTALAWWNSLSSLNHFSPIQFHSWISPFNALSLRTPAFRLEWIPPIPAASFHILLWVPRIVMQIRWKECYSTQMNLQ